MVRHEWECRSIEMSSAGFVNLEVGLAALLQMWMLAHHRTLSPPCLLLSAFDLSFPARLCGHLLWVSHYVWFLGRHFWVDLIKWVSNVRLYVRSSVRPQKVHSISMKFGMYVEVAERCTTAGSMIRSKVKVTSPSKLENWPFSKAISSAIYNGSWQLTTDS